MCCITSERSELHRLVGSDLIVGRDLQFRAAKPQAKAIPRAVIRSLLHMQLAHWSLSHRRRSLAARRVDTSTPELRST